MRLHPDFQAAMLDLDGTLVDTLGDFVAALNSMLDDAGLPHVLAPQVAALVGKGGEFLVHSVLVQAMSIEPTPHEVVRALARFRRHYDAVNGKHASVFPGVFDGLHHLRARGLRLACVTNKPTAASHGLLRAMRLDTFFDVVCGGDRHDRLKPDPLPLTMTCKELHSPPANTLMIGDSVNDALAARAAGCPVVLVTYGYNHGEPVHSVDADGWVDSIADLHWA
jgi:phosphoglycolate phosphatase